MTALDGLRRSVADRLRGVGSEWHGRFFDRVALPWRLRRSLAELERRKAEGAWPRILFVKQDLQDDLYYCPPGASASEIVGSTLLRPGPAALFARWGAEFLILETEADEECGVWKERWTENRWNTIEWMEGYRDAVPGRPVGQRELAIRAADVDWSRYDIVISLDVAVPARITRQFPGVAWCYYIREFKTSAYRRSLVQPAPGQDLLLNHFFRRFVGGHLPHVVEFPYHLHYVGVYQELFGLEPAEGRRGVFLEHYTGEGLDPRQAAALAAFGPVASTALMSAERRIALDAGIFRRSLEPDCLHGLTSSKYWVKFGGRSVLGTGVVEAIAAGCLAIGDPAMHVHGFLFDDDTTATSFDDVMARLAAFESDPSRYRRALRRQQRLVDYLCYARPLLQLFDRAGAVVEARAGRK